MFAGMSPQTVDTLSLEVIHEALTPVAETDEFKSLGTARGRRPITRSAPLRDNATYEGGGEMAGAKPKKVTTRNKDRMNFRLGPEMKERVARAAAITGQELTDFAVSTLSDQADESLERHERLLLTSQD